MDIDRLIDKAAYIDRDATEAATQRFKTRADTYRNQCFVTHEISVARWHVLRGDNANELVTDLKAITT